MRLVNSKQLGCYSADCKCDPVPERLFVCNRCKLTKYCSQECQRAHWPAHKGKCNETAKARKTIVRLEKELRSYEGVDFLAPDSPWIGNLWGYGYGAPRDYVRALHLVGIYTFQAAKETPNSPTLFLEAYDVFVEIMRLTGGDNTGSRYSFAPLLLSLNRLPDLWVFLRYWAAQYKGADDSDDSDEQRPPAKGEWYFGSTEGVDVHDDIEGVEALCMSLGLACSILRLRLINQLKANGGTKEQIVQQRKLLHKSFSAMQRRNKYILPAIVNPGVFDGLEPEHDYGVAVGSIDEARQEWSHYQYLIDSTKGFTHAVSAFLVKRTCNR